MKIAIINPGGITNFGECAIMRGTVIKLKQRYPDAEIAIFGYKDLELADPALYKQLAEMGVSYYDLIIKGRNKASKALYSAAFFLAPYAVMPAESYEYLSEAKVFSKGQESFTQDYGIIHFIDSFLEQLLVSRITKDITLYGQSIGPVYKFRWITGRILKRMKAIDVRDSRSQKELLSLGYSAAQTQLIKDLAFSGVGEPVKQSERKNRHYLIVPNAAICLDADLKSKYLANLDAIIGKLLSSHEKVIVGSSVVASGWNDDYALCEGLKTKYPELELVHYKTLDDFLADVRLAKKVVSSRLHPLIMSSALAIDLLGLSKSHKVKGLLGDLKLESSIVHPFDPISEEDLAKI